MDASNLTPEQAAALAARVAPILDYVTRLSDRMEATHWKPGDPAYAAAWKARKALEEMTLCLTDPRRPLNPPPLPWEPGGSGRGA